MANDAMRENWAEGALGWVANERIFDHVYTPVTDVLIAAADLAGASRVLDVGCGTGALLARAVATGAEAVGVDISEAMTSAARERVPEARVETADAQVADLAAAGPFDRVISRFGVMFFDDPVAAFANLAAATSPGGRLAFVCWRAEETAAFALGLEPLRARLPDGALPPPQPGVPGPLGFADGARIRRVLNDSGWAGIEVAPIDVPCEYGIDGTDGVDARVAVALAGSIGRTARARLEPELGADGWEALVDEMRADLRTRVIGGAVRFEAHIWLVTASRPGG